MEEPTRKRQYNTLHSLQIKDSIAEQGDDVTMEDLVQEMMPKATAMVSDPVKKELCRDMHKALQKNAAL